MANPASPHGLLVDSTMRAWSRSFCSSSSSWLCPSLAHQVWSLLSLLFFNHRETYDRRSVSEPGRLYRGRLLLHRAEPRSGAWWKHHCHAVKESRPTITSCVAFWVVGWITQVEGLPSPPAGGRRRKPGEWLEGGFASPCCFLASDICGHLSIAVTSRPRSSGLCCLLSVVSCPRPRLIRLEWSAVEHGSLGESTNRVTAVGLPFCTASTSRARPTAVAVPHQAHFVHVALPRWPREVFLDRINISPFV